MMRLSRLWLILGGLLIILGGVVLGSNLHKRAAASCAPQGNYGMAAQTLTVATSATYRIWTRMSTPSINANHYVLDIDGSCYTVGNYDQMPLNTLSWIDYQNGNTASTIDVALTAGNHTLKLYGTTPGLEIDRVILASDLTCVPTGDGTNCAANTDTTPPTVSITSPTTGATLSGTTTVQATASDNVGVSKVELYLDGALLATDTTAPYSFSVNTASLSTGTHALYAKAYDLSSNQTSSTVVSFTIAGTIYLPEDINQDGHVNILDFSLLAAKYGQSTGLGRTDINNDGVVNILDFSLLAGKFGQ